jgi:hypothetical protein
MKTIACSNRSKQTPTRRHLAGYNTAPLLVGLALALGLAGPLHAQVAVTNSATHSVLLAWPETTNDCIVVAKDLPTNSTSMWTPWPEPIFKRGQELCMAVPTTAPGQIFQLARGSQFIDDFSDPAEPFGTRHPWVPYLYNSTDTSRFSFTVTNGAFRIRTLAPPVDGRVVIAPPGPLVALPVFRDFSASVEILSFTASGNASLDIYARGHIHTPDFPGDSNGYLGMVARNPTQLAIWDGSGIVYGPSFTYDPAARYRLELSAVGTTLRLRLVNLTTGQFIEQPPITNTMFSQGYVTLAVAAPIGGSYDITLDNFFVTGTMP